MSGRRRTERGILGLPKKKSVLFTFTPRKGEEISSDSDDSDYYPGRRSTDNDDDNALVEKRKRKLVRKRLSKSKKTAPVKKTRKANTKGSEQISQGTGAKMSVHIPPEILLKIFKLGVEMEGLTHYIPRVARVCKAWHQVSMDPLLKKDLDLNADNVRLNKKNIAGLLSTDLSLCRKLSLSGQSKLQAGAIESILEEMQFLRSLDLCECSNVKSELVKKLPDFCPSLERIDLSSYSAFNTGISFSSLENLIKCLGPQLLELRLVRISAVKSSTARLFALIQDHCPKLQVLDIRVSEMYRIRSISPRIEIDLEGLCTSCPHIRELRLDGLNICIQKRLSDAFPGLKELEIFTQCNQMHAAADESVFYHLFRDKQALKLLDISGSQLLPSHVISKLGAVEHLILRDMRWFSMMYNDADVCITAWKPFLKIIDLSNNTFHGQFLDLALGSFGLNWRRIPSPLTHLNLQNTNAKADGVYRVLECCQELTVIDLTSCRLLPRGNKRVFHKNEFPSLIRNLATYIFERSSSEADSDSSDYDSEDNED